MKRAEQLAWAALVGLLVIVAILITGGVLYKFNAYWVGAMLTGGQALVVGLAAWGLMLARQAEELNGPAAGPVGGTRVDAGTPASVGGFRMSAGDDSGTPSFSNETAGNTKILDTGFQRMLVGITGFLLAAMAAAAGMLVYAAYHWANLNPDKVLPVAGTFDKPMLLDELGLVIGLGAAGIYAVLYWITRPPRKHRRSDGDIEAVNSNFTLGIAGMAALGVAAALGYFRVAYASELAAGVMSFLMALQGLELLVNAFRSYSSIEELDQEAIDLQATPLVPMLGSVWLSGLRMLFAQSVGLSGQDRRERGVFARMMPRALVAIVLIAIGVSCIRVVRPGEVAVLERLGYAAIGPDQKLAPEAILKPGMHLTLPWPIDELVTIPTEQLQLTNVGNELHAPKEWQGVDFQFWTIRGDNDADESTDLFITGDPGSPQLLESFIQVQWRVKHPEEFYTAISHSDFFQKGATETKALPIYAAIVQECTSFAITRTFAIHELKQILIDDRKEVEMHCRDILQAKLDDLHCGIEVAYLTIKDLHPPFGRPDQRNDALQAIGGTKVQRGPASAFEFVVSMEEIRQTIVKSQEAQTIAQVNQATGDAASMLLKAQQYSLEKVSRAHGDADRLVNMTENADSNGLHLLGQQMFYGTITPDMMDPVNKIIVDPKVKDVNVIQGTSQGILPVRQP